MSLFIAKITAFFTSIITLFTVIFSPVQLTPDFSGVNTPVKEQTIFDEGEFIQGEYDIFVSPDGNDGNDGTLSSPLKTPGAAKEMLRGIGTDSHITVWFREGTYFIDETLDFTSSDKGNVTYRSYPDEKVEFTGAEAVTGWSETVINGVDAFVTDIEINSDDDYFRSLFKGDRRLSRSVYPKEGTFKIADPCLQEAVVPLTDGLYFSHSVAFYANEGDVIDFANVRDVEAKVMHYWCDEHLPLYSADASTGRILTVQPTAMTLRVDDNFVFENVKEALSLPGEWYLDRSEEKLYYIPEEGDTTENTVLYKGSSKQLITVTGCEDISFRGIDFINTDWDYIDGKAFKETENSSNPLFANVKYGAAHPQAAFEVPAAIHISASCSISFTDCRFENISYTALKFDNASTNCLVTSCMFNETGANAVFIHGENTVPATTNNIDITDCHIGNYGRIFNNAIGILLTYASDCNLTGNEIHDGWYTGISAGWVWGYGENSAKNINISNNLIYNIGNGWLSDMGAIYTLGEQPGTVISGNVIYNVGCDEGRYGYGGWGIYLDEGSSEILVEKNLVYDCSSQTFHQHYGRDNIVRNNIFAFGGDGAFVVTKKEEHNSLTLENNILVTDNAPIYTLNAKKDWFVDNGNLCYDYTRGGNIVSGASMSLTDRKSLVIMTAKGYYNNAVFENPLFRDAENRDFTLAANSPAFTTGFEAWDYTTAGTDTLFE